MRNLIIVVIIIAALGFGYKTGALASFTASFSAPQVNLTMPTTPQEPPNPLAHIEHRLSYRPAANRDVAYDRDESAAVPHVTTAEGVHLASFGDLEAAIRNAQTITVSAYTLQPTGRMARDLEDAAAHGAHVSLALSGNALPEAVRDNERDASTYANRGIRVHLTSEPLHMKAVIADSAVFLSDRNWTPSAASIILAVPASTRYTIERAILGQTGNAGPLTTRKDDSLNAEADLLEEPAPSIFVETESFGPGLIAEALARQAQRGANVTFVVARSEYEQSPSEQQTVHTLQGLGVHAFVSDSDEKIAVVGTRAWTGSSNATSEVPDQVDWSYTIDNAQIAQILTDHVRRDSSETAP